ncbi:MAG: hypothetical protein KC503_06705, partial [Myxococcales bacterium]|nr:hypothetical protein [Myxococcales bacterium]
LCVQAATLLARAGDAAGVGQLARLVHDAQSSDVRTAALRWALLRASKDQATKLAVAALGDPSLYVALDAAEWLYRREK